MDFQIKIYQEHNKVNKFVYNLLRLQFIISAKSFLYGITVDITFIAFQSQIVILTIVKRN